MIASDAERFRKALQVVADVYGHKLDNDQARFYWDCLADRPIEDVEKRMRAHAQRGKFFPKPRDLRPIEAHAERIETDLAKDRKWQDGQRFNRATWALELARDPAEAKRALCEALWARYSCESDQSSTVLAAKREWLAERFRQLGGDLRKLVPPAPPGTEPGQRVTSNRAEV